MKKIIHITILMLIGLLCMGTSCPSPFTPIGEYKIWTIYPIDGTIIYEPEITLIWSDSGQNADHWLFFGTSPDDLHNICPYEDFCFDTFNTVSSLELSTTYYWYAEGLYEARDRYNTEYTEIVSFTTADEFYIPGQVHTPTPDSAAIGVSVNPNFAWEVYNPDVTPYDYDIYLGTITDPPLLVSGLSAPWYTLLSDTLDNTTLYYWRVEAYSGVDTVMGPLWEFTTDYPSEADIFALLEIDAKQTPSGYHVEEEIRARFDTGTAIDIPIEPLQADSVFIENVKLDWSASSQSYSHFVLSEPIVENGQPNNIVVHGNSEVPNLNTNFIFPACTLGITDPESFENVPFGGFEVTWDGSECGGMVWLTLMDGNDSTGVWKEVTNDGLDSLTATDLAPLSGQTGTYNLIIIKQVEENIDAPGYRNESLIRARAINVMPQINITSGK